MIGAIPMDFYRLPSAKLGIASSAGSVHFKLVAKRNNKEGTI